MKYKLKKGVSLENIEDNLILVTDNGDTAILNDIAGDILSWVKDDTDSAIIIDHIAEEYKEVDRNVIQTDVDDLLFELSEKEFLELY